MQEQTKAPWESELEAMAAVAKAMETLDNEARGRVLRWWNERFVPEQAPAALAPASERSTWPDERWREFIRQQGNLAPRPAQVAMATDNIGHGHVRPRPDGVRARCGGPGLCSECAAEDGREPGKVAPAVRLRDLALERDLALANRDTARAEARSQRGIAEEALAGRVAP